MKISELIRLDERAPLLDKLSKYAQSHYRTKDENEALLLLLARGMVHSKEDDDNLKLDVSEINNKLEKLDKEIKTTNSNLNKIKVSNSDLNI